MADDTALALTKRTLRKKQSRLRKVLAASDVKADVKVSSFAKQIISLSNKTSPIIALYLAIGSELKLSVLADALISQGAKIAMPVVVEKNSPLIFRQWHPNCDMAADMFDILAPSNKNPALNPDIIVLPSLAFDVKGGRLGYGGGFYDRTLAAIKGEIITIVVGYAAQKVEKVPMGLHDLSVGYILTENELLAIEF